MHGTTVIRPLPSAQPTACLCLCVSLSLQVQELVKKGPQAMMAEMVSQLLCPAIVQGGTPALIKGYNGIGELSLRR